MSIDLPCEMAQHRFGTATAVMPLLGFPQSHSLHGVVAWSQDSTAKYPHQPLDGRALTVVSDQPSGGLSSFLSKGIRTMSLDDSLSLVKASCW